MSSESAYENYRNILMMNLCTVTQDPETIQNVLKMVDISMSDFEITRKPMEIIPAADMLPVIKCYLASKAIANRSRGTIKQYKYKLDHFFNTLRKSYLDITPNDIRVYLAQFQIERNASGSYVDNVRVTLNSFFQWLVDNDYLVKNPCAKVEKTKFQPNRVESLTSIQLEEIRWNTVDVREKALVDFFYSTGCRASECAGVNLTDINWENRSVVIRHGKGDKKRTVFFNSESEVSLKEYLKTRSDSTDALFVSMKSPHQRLKPPSLERIIKKVSVRTGIRCHAHKLRHTFATASINSGMPLEVLQMLMGHSKPETTMIYITQNQANLQMEHRKAFT